MVGLIDERQGANPMKRLLLTCAAATAIMLTACIDVDLARSDRAIDGGRVIQTTGVTAEAQTGSEDPGSNPEASAPTETADALRDSSRQRQ